MEELSFACQLRVLECLGNITSLLAYESRLFRKLHKKNSPTCCSPCYVWCYHNLQCNVTLEIGILIITWNLERVVLNGKPLQFVYQASENLFPLKLWTPVWFELGFCCLRQQTDVISGSLLIAIVGWRGNCTALKNDYMLWLSVKARDWIWWPY